MAGALAGVRVIDLSRVLAGPMCTLQLADMGAEVIKVERPKYGDDSRFFGPVKNGQSGYYIMLNRGKKGITLDFKKAAGANVLQNLLASADVVVENFKPGVMEKLGFGYEEVIKINPKIIYASISGFGQYGPYRERPGYDIVAQAMAGLMSITGFPDNPPTKAGGSVGDLSAGLYAAMAIMTALYAREKTGIGQKIDISLQDAVFTLCETNIVRHTIGGIEPVRVGSRHPLSAPFDIYQAKDGYVTIAVANESLAHSLFELMGQPELHQDPRFETDAIRSKNEQELKTIIEQWLASYTVAEAVAMMMTHSIPASPVLSVSQACADPQILAREMLVEVEQPGLGKIKIPGNPMKLSATPAQVNRPAPLLGQDNEEVLRSLCGYDQSRIQSLRASGII